MKKLLSLFIVLWITTTAAVAADLTVTTNKTTSIGATAATLNGAVTGDTPTEVGFEYKANGSSEWTKVACPEVSPVFSYVMADRQLIAGWEFSVRAYATGAAGTVYGAVNLFTTAKLSAWCTQSTNEQNWDPANTQMHSWMKILEGETEIVNYEHPPKGLTGVSKGLVYGNRCPASSFTYSAKRGSTFTLSIQGNGILNIAYWADWNADRSYTTAGDGYGLAWNTAEERVTDGAKKDFVIAIPSDAKLGLTRIRTYCDGGEKSGTDLTNIGKNFVDPCQKPSWCGSFVDFEINILPETETPERTLNVEAKDTSILKAVITGGSDVSKTSNEAISVTASLQQNMSSLYSFSHWSNKANGEILSTASPFVYYGAEDISIEANHRYVTPAIRYVGGVWKSATSGTTLPATGIAIVPGPSKISVTSTIDVDSISDLEWNWELTGAPQSSTSGSIIDVAYDFPGQVNISHYISDKYITSNPVSSSFTVEKPDYLTGTEALICNRPVGASNLANPTAIPVTGQTSYQYYLGANKFYNEWGEKFDFSDGVQTLVSGMRILVAYSVLKNFDTPFIARFYQADENGLPGKIAKEFVTTAGAVFGKNNITSATATDWLLPEKVRIEGAFFVTFEMELDTIYNNNRFGIRQSSTSGSSLYIKKEGAWKKLGDEYDARKYASSGINLNATVFAPTPTPTNFAAATVSKGTAALSWEAGDATQWKVEYKTPSDSVWSSVVVSEPSYNLPVGFLATYEVRVSAVNDGWRLSSPTEVVSVTSTVEAINYISTLAELKAWRDHVNAGDNFAGKTVQLTSDIDMEGADWTPITHANGFSGTFDGQFFALKNMKMTFSDNNPNGFIRFLNNGGTIKKLGIEGIDSPSALAITASAGTGNGVFVGKNKGGVIEDSYSKVNVLISKAGAVHFGAFVGNNGANGGKISRCVNYGEVTSNSTAKSWEIAGIMGEQSEAGSIVENCYNVGDINLLGGIETDQASGIVGTIWGSNAANRNIVRNSYNLGAISSKMSAYFIVNNGQFGSVTNNYFLSTAGGTATMGTNSGSALSKTESQLKEEAMVASLNAGGTSPWMVDDKANPINNGYPILKWQANGISLMPVTGITLTTATLNASYASDVIATATEAGFYYRLQGHSVWMLASATLAETFSSDIKLLDENKDYEFKAFVKFDENAYKESAIMTFSTRPLISISSSLPSSGTVAFVSPASSELAIRHYGPVTVKATKASETSDRFLGWFYKASDELITRDETATIARKEVDTELEARFEATPVYSFTFSWTPIEGGTVVATLEDGTPVVSGTSLLEGTKINLEATLNPGYRTANWSDGQNEMTSVSITLSNLNNNMVASLIAIPIYTLSCTVAPHASWGTVIGNTGELTEGTLVELTASANSGYEFDQWIIDDYEFGSNPIFQQNDDLKGFTLDANTLVTARFKLDSGVEEQTANGINVFVTDNKLFVIGAEQSLLTLNNIGGGSIFAAEVVSNEFSVELPEANGMYLVTLTNAQGAITTFKVTK